MKTELKPMTVVELKVVRTSDMGVFLDAGTGNTSNDILLHKAQQNAQVNVGDTVKVFLYLDPKGRLTASMRVPKMQVGQISRLKIINTTADGAFVDAGAERGIFMPFAEMCGRPKVGEIVWAKLYVDKSGRLAASMDVADEIRRASKPAVNIKRGDSVTGAIYNITEAGAFIFSEGRHIVFVPKIEIPRMLRVGEVVTARVTFVRDDGRLNASLRDTKERELDRDAEKIFAFMQENGGKLVLNDKSPPEKIFAVFKMSKAAFKRAVGHMFCERRIQKVGDNFTVAESFVRDDGRLNASLRATKERELDPDAEKIFAFMQENGGKLVLNDKSPPEKIFAVFKMSKAAFKRAVGHLFRERRIQKVGDNFTVAK